MPDKLVTTRIGTWDCVTRFRIQLLGLGGATLALLQPDEAVALDNAIEFWLTGLYATVTLTYGTKVLWGSPKRMPAAFNFMDRLGA
ncbi:hypothetical protein sos41_32250 [Alphaproteobacteria bacterium SO-S41]|nr:hypothetical protein sos41_32250 [Alphaproteobacteria bacterium SO-S41]